MAEDNFVEAGAGNNQAGMTTTENVGSGPGNTPLPSEEEGNKVTDYTPPVTPGGIEDLPVVKTEKFSGISSNLKGLSAKALQMRDILLAQPAVGFVIPLDPLEKPGAMESVTINGYTMHIKKGEFVKIPEQVAMLLAESHNLTNDILNNNPANLSNPFSTNEPGFRKADAGL